METAVALGTFDGLHSGHRKVLNLPDGYKKTAVIFPLPPKAIILNLPCCIMTAEEKIDAIKSLGMDEVYSLNFCKIKDMEPEEFLLFLKNKFNPSYISCGFNYHFGKNARGNTELLKSFCEQNGIILKCSEPVLEGEIPISSTIIRNYLKNGEVERANELLMKPFSFTAPIVAGDKRGRTIGFPTINQKYPELLVPLKSGVYKVKALVDGKTYDGIANIGLRPTFKTDMITSETYIKDFSGDLYGKEVTIVPQRFIREEVKFSSIEELKNQIKKDIKTL